MDKNQTQNPKKVMKVGQMLNPLPNPADKGEMELRILKLPVLYRITPIFQDARSATAPQFAMRMASASIANDILEEQEPSLLELAILL
ncbi:hypothetical protein TWF281_004306 [Arthrobotrys megalospora]